MDIISQNLLVLCRSEDEEVLMQFLQDSENNWMRNRRQGRHTSPSNAGEN